MNLYSEMEKRPVTWWAVQVKYDPVSKTRLLCVVVGLIILLRRKERKKEAKLKNSVQIADTRHCGERSMISFELFGIFS